MTNPEERLEKMEADLRQNTRDMGVMSQAMAEMLAWAKETETNGIKPGTMATAHNVVRMGHLRTEAYTIRLTLEQLGNGATLPAIKKALQARVEDIEAQIAALGE
jgi:hypothetical protein